MKENAEQSAHRHGAAPVAAPHDCHASWRGL